LPNFEATEQHCSLTISSNVEAVEKLLARSDTFSGEHVSVSPIVRPATMLERRLGSSRREEIQRVLDPDDIAHAHY
jgi:hypothetical protein